LCDNFLLEELLELVKQIKPRLEGQNSISKNLAEIFLDMWGAMTSCGEMYDSDAQRGIYGAVDHLAPYARDICTS
jgi:hypothetical protein